MAEDRGMDCRSSDVLEDRAYSVPVALAAPDGVGWRRPAEERRRPPRSCVCSCGPGDASPGLSRRRRHSGLTPAPGRRGAFPGRNGRRANACRMSRPNDVNRPASAHAHRHLARVLARAPADASRGFAACLELSPRVELPCSRFQWPSACPPARWAGDADLVVEDLGALCDAHLTDHDAVVSNDANLAIVTPTE
jgi:hypothetical protein